jgi:hypothetical protein
MVAFWLKATKLTAKKKKESAKDLNLITSIFYVLID